MTSARKSPLPEPSNKYKRRKQGTEYNHMGVETKINTVTLKEFDSTTQTDVNSMSTMVGAETLYPDQTLDDFNSVCVKVEADEWCNIAACFYAGSTKSEQVLGKEICQETDTFHGRGKREDLYIPCPVKTLQGGIKKEPVLDEIQDAGYKFPEEHRLRNLKELPLSEFGSQEVFQDFANGQFTPSVQHSSSDLTPFHLALKTEANTLSTSPVQGLPMNVSPSITSRLVTAASSKSTDAWDQKECDISIKKEVPTHQLIGLSSDVTDSMDQTVAILPTNDPHAPMPVISYNSKSNLSHNNSESHSNKVPWSISSKIEEVAMTSKVVKSNDLLLESGDGSSGDFEEIFIERNKETNKSYPSTLPAPKKVRGSSSCMNQEPLVDDNLLYCVECNKEFEGDCTVHGPYNYIRDKEVPEVDTSRSFHTLPDDLEIKTSTIVGAGLGVFSKVGLESRIMFGPYDGTIITENPKSGYCWQIYKDGKAIHYVNAQDKTTSNWMRYVNFAMKEADKNLVAFQYKGGIYYCTFKPLSSGEELLMWYGDECARELGLSREDGLIRDKNLHFRPKYVNGEEFFQCVYCKIAFTTAVFLVRHLKRMHGGDKLSSKDLQVLDQWRGKNDHQNDHNYSKQINPTSNERHLNSITNVTHNKSNISHSVCEQQLTNAILHKNNNVEVCKYNSNIINGIKTNKRIPTGKKLYMCEVCGYACYHKGNLKTHIMIHTGEKLYKCEVCGHSFTQSSTLKNHMQIHTTEKLYKCEVCGYACNQSGHLKTHMMRHTGEGLYKCEVCGYAFNVKCNLKTHMMRHTGDKPYKCEVCGYKCIKNSTLTTHMRIHTGERVYKCELCDYACSQSCNLRRHMMIHTGERKYQCEVCGYACNQKGNLTLHMRIHTGEREYTCDVCSNAFSHKCSLKRHMKIHTGV
ncbi:histone-lysine N-methyltransferase PRDM9-like [Dreissena polymorpha]|uniref:Uncharacterized protein n=1 Tax=Dreissena polymorpha TaxID=45954 RepID=A0A9D4K7M0_DREPO|nr:histone-lysine N-methyltransferase PRDM9-like [Dreissena polymorpha]XP_052279751.1 histone-lysine N-methyltransferase PRDM9-like [Dreissena polymorpha]XP_052279752.1 histone-lysine N-methyltransferase PRDM9-like [Dreissena polymorpha]KAH3834424.1 hypothetical protein DPMN_107749 [Dreissena polymorpha]